MAIAYIHRLLQEEQDELAANVPLASPSTTFIRKRHGGRIEIWHSFAMAETHQRPKRPSTLSTGRPVHASHHAQTKRKKNKNVPRPPFSHVVRLTFSPDAWSKWRGVVREGVGLMRREIGPCGDGTRSISFLVARTAQIRSDDVDRWVGSGDCFFFFTRGLMRMVDGRKKRSCPALSRCPGDF